MELSKDAINDSLRQFTARRDALLHEDTETFEHHLRRFLEFCRQDPLAKSVIEPVESQFENDIDAWWEKLNYQDRELPFPSGLDEEFIFFYRFLESIENQESRIWTFTHVVGKNKTDDGINQILSLVARPFAKELSHRLGKAADLATPEARDLQAVPLKRIPSSREVRIFLSHKSVDKPIVQRYYDALKQAGFSPWLDDTDMPAGTDFERAILQGFEESCAAVFFITENFRDEKYLGAEVGYAISQKRKKEKKFSIITLHYPNAKEVPPLLQQFIYKDITNDLEGLYQILRALPIELGPVRWKLSTVD